MPGTGFYLRSLYNTDGCLNLLNTCTKDMRFRCQHFITTRQRNETKFLAWENAQYMQKKYRLDVPCSAACTSWLRI